MTSLLLLNLQDAIFAGLRMLPGSGAEDFFESWLRYGTGGGCWSGAGACHALLTSLGFDAGRGVGTMLIVRACPRIMARWSSRLRVSFILSIVRCYTANRSS